ncbi:uncharacterized protein LOC106369893 [Brassica napus]|uniref:uncharacterized protein LOC106369893 n=2 Tax=Brassica TaxID=3705 RepID=UPI002078FE37|nr:uncharacterized protein LOC106369893 [Brassica napus]
MTWCPHSLHSLTVIPMIGNYDRDELSSQLLRSLIYINPGVWSSVLSHLQSFSFPLINPFHLRFIIMGENLRRGIQNITLGADDPPVALPTYVINEAVAENRFVLIGRPVMPRRQNIRAIIATLPRSWGYEGIQGRLVEGRRFQFVFPSEESLEMVIRRGPWAFADRMLIMERWTPDFNPLMLNFIPFWIQIRGIPFQYMSQDVVIHIGRALGMYMEVDYNAEVTARREYARVRINWNVDEPLRFQKQFQFLPGINTLLRINYERLRGFCEVCGMLTHDSGACLIQNGGQDNADEDDDNGSDDDNAGDGMANEPGLIIEEVVEAEEQAAAARVPDEVLQEEYERGIAAIEEEADEEALWNGETRPTLPSEDIIMGEMYSPFTLTGERCDGLEGLKRKAWMESAAGNVDKFNSYEQGETSEKRYTRRKKMAVSINVVPEETRNNEDSSANTNVGGAVGPKPPQPP